MIKFHHKELSNISPNAKIGDGCTIHSHVIIYDDVVIGENCKIQARAFLPNGVTLGNNVFVGPGAIFTNDKNPPSNHLGWEKTFVEDHAVIGAGAVILPGITIGEAAVVGAGAVVTKNVDRGSIVVGNPAKPLIKN